MSAYVHHLQDGVFVRQVHIGDTATTGCMRSDTVVTGHHHFTLTVPLHIDFSICFLLSLLHGQFGVNLCSQRRNRFRQFL